MAEKPMRRDRLRVLVADFLYKLHMDWRNHFGMEHRDLITYLLELSIAEGKSEIKLHDSHFAGCRSHPYIKDFVPFMGDGDDATSRFVLGDPQRDVGILPPLIDIGIIKVWPGHENLGRKWDNVEWTFKTYMVDLSWTPERVHA